MTDSTTEPIVSWAVGFLTGGFFGFRSGWLWGRGGAVRRTPFIFNEGHATRTNSGPGPTTPKPDIVPKPQPPSGRVVDVYGRTIGYIPRSQGDTPNPPPEVP